MSNGQITGKEIGFIGGMGGLCLSLLKLIESGFFIDNFWSTNSLAAYFTYIVYIFFGVVMAFYFAERSLAVDKIKKNAFILGLLAPSLLLALTARPIGKEGSLAETLESLPKLGSLIVRSAYAQSAPCPGGYIKAPDDKCVEGDEIKKKQVEPTFGQAVLTAIGRAQPPEKYIFVVGITKDGAKAEEVAKNIREKILKSKTSGEISAKVVRPEGKGVLFVTVGTLSSKADALKVKAMVESSAINALTKAGDPVTKSSAELLLKGRIIEGRTLFDPKI
jgi:hypothetical protein